MDPFSISVGALGIAPIAISSITSLCDLIDSIANAEQVVKDLSFDLQATQRCLIVLADIVTSNAAARSTVKEELERTGVADAVNKCGKASDDFLKKLSQWTKQSSSRLSIGDRLAVGVWQKEKLSKFRTEVQTCRASVQFAVQSTQLLLQVRSEQQSAVERSLIKQQLQELEATIREHIDIAKREQSDVQSRRLELQKLDAESDEDEAQKELGLREVDERDRLLEAHQASVEVVLAQIQRRLAEQDISNVLTAADSKALVGMPGSDVGKMDQRIHHVRTLGNSRAIVGVYDGDFSAQDMFKA